MTRRKRVGVPPGGQVTPEWVAKECTVVVYHAKEGDDECAHSEEDSLRYEVMLAIAEGRCSEPAECCRLVLDLLELDFARWCA